MGALTLAKVVLVSFGAQHTAHRTNIETEESTAWEVDMLVNDREGSKASSG